MPNAYTWQFVRLDVYPTYGALANVVQSVHWEVTASDGVGHAAQAYGEQSLGPPDPENFTPFAELTQAQVQGWTEAALGAELAAMQSQLDAAIQQQISPSIVPMSPPWV